MLPPTPPSYTHPTESGRVNASAYYIYQKQVCETCTGQADHDTVHTVEAQVTSAESASGQGVQYGALSAGGDSVHVVP